ncbi:release factor glutamine methyltransferase [Oscillospiraceae bacterium]|nr:release factor glutamine methyltransferase [Oscillospiraceae bacterium]BDF75896.1 release factor glutamine methyltransferase [Oscillospiraceae bacterium]
MPPPCKVCVNVATTYNNLYLDARRRLREAGIEAAQLEAREIVCSAAGKTREQFFRDMPLYASAQVEEQVEALIRRRLGGEPVAYIIGEWEFYGMPLDISTDVLIPRSDTEVLAEQAILIARGAGEGARVLDLCAGSGCVGLAVAENAPNCRVVLADASEGALRICKQNVRRNDLNARVTVVQADARERPAAALWDFDVIACNPPYIPHGDIPGLDPSVRDYEPRLALDGGADGLDFYRVIAEKWGSALRLGGTLLFEVGIGQAPDVERILAGQGYENIQTFADTQGIWRVVSGVVENG